MSIVQQHTAASLSDAWRTINIDALQEDSSLNFDTTTLHPPLPEISETEVRQLAGQVRQLLRGGRQRRRPPGLSRDARVQRDGFCQGECPLSSRYI